MSEYQYYEFIAIDRSLTEEEMDWLRGLSTRADITPVSFTNEYHWGDFKGSPDKLMQRCFDAHVYVANLMTAIFMLRLPIKALAKETTRKCCTWRLNPPQSVCVARLQYPWGRHSSMAT